MNIIYKTVLFGVLLGLISCSYFVKDEEVKKLYAHHKETYKMKVDKSANELKLKSGEKVRLKIVESSESIKVYAMPISSDMLKGQWVLILYIFDTEFPNQEYDYKFFRKKLDEIVEKV